MWQKFADHIEAELLQVYETDLLLARIYQSTQQVKILGVGRLAWCFSLDDILLFILFEVGHQPADDDSCWIALVVDGLTLVAEQ